MFYIAASLALANAAAMSAAIEERVDKLIGQIKTISISTQNPCSFVDLCLEPRFYDLSWSYLEPPPDRKVIHPVMKELVGYGIKALPALLKRIDDRTDTGYYITHSGGMGGILTENAFNGRYLTADQNRFFTSFRYDALDSKYTATVGDFCMAAAGQIVNRSFWAMRPQPTNCIMISSASRCKELAQAIRKDWTGLTPGEHFAQLKQDLYMEEQTTDDGAIKRLMFYYPDQTAPLAVAMLNRPLNDWSGMHEKFERLNKAKDESQIRAIYAEIERRYGKEAAASLAPQLYYQEVQNRWSPPPTDEERKKYRQIRKVLFPDFDPFNTRMYQTCQIYDQISLLRGLAKVKNKQIDLAAHRLFKRAQAQLKGEDREYLDELSIRIHLRLRGTPEAKDVETFFRARVKTLKPVYGADEDQLRYMKEALQKKTQVRNPA